MRIQWLPYQLDPTITEPEDKLARYVQKFGPRAERMLKDPNNMFNQRVRPLLGKVPESHLFTYVEGSKVFNDFSAHVLMGHRAVAEADLGDKLMSIFFRDYFQNGKSFHSRDALAAAAKEAGLTEAVVDDALGDAALIARTKQEIAQYARGGINGVPHIIMPNGRQLSGAQEVETFAALLQECKGR